SRFPLLHLDGQRAPLEQLDDDERPAVWQRAPVKDARHGRRSHGGERLGFTAKALGERSVGMMAYLDDHGNAVFATCLPHGAEAAAAEYPRDLVTPQRWRR